MEVDREIISFLDNPRRMIRKVPLRMELQIHEDLAILGQHLRTHNEEFNSLWMGDLMCSYSKSRQRIHEAMSHWGIGWLRLTYEWDIEFSRADVNFWGNKVRLRRLSNVDAEEIIENCQLCREQAE
jgi:hypothetical protein